MRKNPLVGGVESTAGRVVTREKLLATAEMLFLTRGYTATTVEAAAAAAGFTTGAIYSNFGGKAELFLAVLERTFERQLEQIRAALESARTDEERLRVIDIVVTRDPAEFRARLVATSEFVLDARGRPDLLERIGTAQRTNDEALGDLLVAICGASGVEPPEDMGRFVADVGALVTGLVLRSLFDPEIDLTQATSRAIFSLLGNGTPALPSGLESVTT